LLLFAFGDLLCKFFLESFNASCRIDKFLLAGKERMTVRTNFDAERFAGGRRTCFEFRIATGAMDGYCVIAGMNTFFHSLFLNAAQTGFAVRLVYIIGPV
jgi:hypothetical protein